jgi:hypothetical protein
MIVGTPLGARPDSAGIAGQAESSGGSAGSAGAPVSRHAGSVGKGGGWLIGWVGARSTDLSRRGSL